MTKWILLSLLLCGVVPSYAETNVFPKAFQGKWHNSYSFGNSDKRILNSTERRRLCSNSEDYEYVNLIIPSNDRPVMKREHEGGTDSKILRFDIYQNDNVSGVKYDVDYDIGEMVSLGNEKGTYENSDAYAQREFRKRGRGDELKFSFQLRNGVLHETGERYRYHEDRQGNMRIIGKERYTMKWYRCR